MADDAKFKAAQAKLDEAVEAFLRDSGLGEEGTVTTGWVLIAHQAGWRGNDSISHHPLVYMNGSMPDHTALGLLQVASDIVRGVGRWSREEE